MGQLVGDGARDLFAAAVKTLGKIVEPQAEALRNAAAFWWRHEEDPRREKRPPKKGLWLALLSQPARAMGQGSLQVVVFEYFVMALATVAR